MLVVFPRAASDVDQHHALHSFTVLRGFDVLRGVAKHVVSGASESVRAAGEMFALETRKALSNPVKMTEAARARPSRTLPRRWCLVNRASPRR